MVHWGGVEVSGRAGMGVRLQLKSDFDDVKGGDDEAGMGMSVGVLAANVRKD
jgi:hypothetical protein